MKTHCVISKTLELEPDNTGLISIGSKDECEEFINQLNKVDYYVRELTKSEKKLVNSKDNKKIDTSILFTKNKNYFKTYKL